MQVKRIVEITAESTYVGYYGLEITDIEGNEVKINLTKDQIATLADRFKDKADRNRKEQLEKLREQLEELESESC